MPRTASARAQPLSGAEPEPRTTGCNSAADVLSRDAVSGGFAKRGSAEARTRRCAFYLPTPMSVLDSAGVTSSIARPRPSAFFWSRTRAVRGRSCLTRARSRSRGSLRRGDGLRRIILFVTSVSGAPQGCGWEPGTHVHSHYNSGIPQVGSAAKGLDAYVVDPAPVTVENISGVPAAHVHISLVEGSKGETGPVERDELVDPIC